ncbi:MAG: hypothetical protein G01um101448_143 [Parcubacteria group bacterium Gr01-1014_48]|nr:MAG: hypothetical protein Greene041614_98 [Parcubacteria group bacterium Greene0416_14]TSC74416.1 MAG: hypothetical protein G01um101448_143 [Parcubacteria group bacterium Gr01-1014_48]TSD01269.1 MAG: hypothetical protein Greene101415_358 [Parcubacteria group bacterium Greene1014_15]TSD08410.1 MAG: hypothetical protein Greene07144_126 [Parcubacteria group bacterium Greene0714_4]
MANEEQIELLGSLSNLLDSQKTVVESLMVVEKACHVQKICQAREEDWDTLMQAVKKWMDAGAEFSRVVCAYTELVRAGYRDAFLSGFYVALVRTERFDLLESFPEVEVMGAVIEAQNIARKIKPPESEDDASSEV